MIEELIDLFPIYIPKGVIQFKQITGLNLTYNDSNVQITKYNVLPGKR